MYETAVHPGPADISGYDVNGDNGGFMGFIPPIGDISDMDWAGENVGEYAGFTATDDQVFHDIVRASRCKFLLCG
jgi:hypothetical protein